MQITKAGERVPTEISAHKFCLNNQQVVLAIVRDITERKRMMESLRESEEKYRAVFQYANDALFLVKLSEHGKLGLFLEVNDVACALLGYSRDELLTMSPYDIDAPEFAEFEVAARQQLRSQAAVTFEIEQVAKDGHHIPVEISAHTFCLNNELVVLAIARDITERKRFIASLRESEENAHAILNATGETILLFERDGRILLANATAAQRLASTPEKMVGGNIYDFLPSEVAEHRRLHHLQAFDTSQPVHFEDERAGRCYDTNVLPILDAEGHVTRVALFSRDITERRQAEEALHESVDRFRTLVESTSDWVWEVDRNAVYTYSSPKVTDLLGYTPEEIIGKTPFELMPPDEAERVGAIFVEIGKAHRPFARLENTNRRKDGRLVVLETSGVPIFDEAGAFTGYRGIDRDITERKQAEAERERLLCEVERRAAELDATINAITDGIVIYDTNGELVNINPSAQRMLGYSLDDLHLPTAERLALLRYETPEGQSFYPFEAQIFPAIRGVSTSNIIVVIHRRDDTTLWFSSSTAPIRTGDGQLLGAVMSFTDITAIHELQKEQEDFLHIVSHDLRIPLTVIHGHMQLLESSMMEAGINGGMRTSVDAIQRSVQRMNLMIQDLVIAARLSGERLTLKLQPVDLGEYLPSLLAQVVTSLDISRIILDLPPELPPVSADADRLERIMLNLLSNALKYSPQEAPVLLKARQVGEEVVVSVTDQGRGISLEDLPHIFERFSRLRAGREPESIGLGLYITRMLVLAHGGHIWVESEVGIGSTFSFSLPVAER